MAGVVHSPVSTLQPDGICPEQTALPNRTKRYSSNFHAPNIFSVSAKPISLWMSQFGKRVTPESKFKTVSKVFIRQKAVRLENGFVN